MDIKVFSSLSDLPYCHSNELFCGDYDNADFPYLYVSSQPFIVIVAIEDNSVIGGIQLGYSEDGWMCSSEVEERPKWSMLGIGVIKGQRGKGITKKLIKKQFEVMNEVGIDYIVQSSYSVDGFDYTYKIFQHHIGKNPNIRYINEPRML